MTNQFYKKAHKKLRWLRDSKLLLSRQREFYAGELLKQKDLVYALSYSSPKTIDKMNIYNAARQAMKKTIMKLDLSYKLKVISKENEPKTYNLKLKTIALVDGKTKIKGLNIEQMPIIKGDRKVFAIACASIIAKVRRDKMMVRYAKKYPGYGLEKHKGYGTKLHLVCLTSLGPTPIHRLSFEPVARLM